MTNNLARMPLESLMNPQHELPLARPIVTCADIMTVKAQTVGRGASLRDAHARMRLSGFRHLPVVDAQGRLIGMLSSSDIKAAWGRGFEGLVEEVMTTRTSAMHPETPAKEAVSRMIEDDVRSLPIIDRDSVVVGIITTTDLLRLAYRALVVQEYLGEHA